MKILVTEYQSIQHAKLEVSGFTAITGPSNIGKSALLRAITAALFGQEGNHFVRKGAPSCAVTVERGDQHVEWSRVRKKTVSQESCLILNGVKHTRLGRDGHADLTAGLGFSGVRAGSATIYPQVARQLDPPFLLGETPNATADVFKMLGRIDVVTRAQGAAKSDLRKTTAEAGLREKDRIAAVELMSQLGWVPAFEEFLRQLESRLGGAAAEIHTLAEALDQIEALEALEPVEVPDPPILPNVDPIEDLLKQIDEHETLVPPGDLPDLPDVAAISAGILAAENLLALAEQYEETDKAHGEALWTLGETELDMKVTRQKREELEGTLSVCPTCGQDIEPDALELGAAVRAQGKEGP